MKPLGAWFLEQIWSGDPGVQVKNAPRAPRDRRARPSVGRAPCLVGPSGGHRRTSSSYIYLRTPKTSRSTTKPYFHCRNLLYPRDPILGPFPELRRRGHWSWRASTSTPWPLRWCVSSLPQTFGFILLAKWLILSLWILMTHKYRGSIVVLLISKSVKPNAEQKEMTSGFQQGILCKHGNYR